MNHVVVRIRKIGNEYVVIGRKTQQAFSTFEAAWSASIPYFAGYKT